MDEGAAMALYFTYLQELGFKLLLGGTILYLTGSLLSYSYYHVIYFA